MKYIVLLNQGMGCDYTIGCGLAYEIYDASSPEDAFAQWVHSPASGGCAL